MALELLAIKSDMNSVARKVERSLSNFEDATTRTNQAAEQLISEWEGDARNAFAVEQERNIETYRKLESIIRSFIDTVDKAIEAYTETDAECARLLRSV